MTCKKEWQESRMESFDPDAFLRMALDSIENVIQDVKKAKEKAVTLAHRVEKFRKEISPVR